MVSHNTKRTQAESGLQTESSARDESLWRNREYASWFTADTASAVGAAMKTLALSLLGYAVSGSLTAAGWLGTLSLIAQQGMNIFGGTYVDRHSKKNLIIINATVGFMLWGAVALLSFLGRLSFITLVVISVVASAINGFLGSATDAMLRSIINIRDYPKARSVNEGRDSTINMVSGPLSGFFYALLPLLPFLMSSLMYAVSGVAAAKLHPLSQARGGEEGAAIGKSFMSDFWDGWKWFAHRKTVLLSVGAASLSNFGINGIQYAIQLNLTGMKVNSTYIGMVNAGISIGMFVGSLIANRISGNAHVGHAVCLSFVFICLVLIPMIMSDNRTILIVCNALIGVPVPIINSLLLGFIFAKAPKRMQGRVTVALSAPSQILSAFCSAIAGTLLPVVGFRGTMTTFSAAFFLGAVLILAAPSIRQIPSAAHWEDADLS